jgi:two-component system, LytTR family, response regulator
MAMNTGKLTVDDMILLADSGKCQIVRVGEISSLEVDGNYISVKKRDGDMIGGRASLAHCEKRFPPNFFRTGRNAMVNLAEVAKLNAASRNIVLTMKDGTRITLSRIQSLLFRKQLLL